MKRLDFHGMVLLAKYGMLPEDIPGNVARAYTDIALMYDADYWTGMTPEEVLAWEHLANTMAGY